MKKRVAITFTLFLLMIATVIPVGAQDNTSAPSPTNGTNIITIHIGGPNDGWTISLSLPIRCGNNC